MNEERVTIMSKMEAGNNINIPPIDEMNLALSKIDNFISELDEVSKSVSVFSTDGLDLDGVDAGLEGIKRNIKNLLSNDSTIIEIRQNFCNVLGLVSDDSLISFEKYDYGTNEKGWLSRTGASIVNGTVSILLGVGKVVEGLSDMVNIIKTYEKSNLTLLADLIKGDLSFGNTKKLWESTKANVTVDYTGLIGDHIYASSIGQKLNSLAYDRYKYNNQGCNNAEAIGTLGGKIALYASTGFLGPVAVGLVSGGISIQDRWNDNYAILNSSDNEQMQIHLSYNELNKIRGLAEGESFSVNNLKFTSDGLANYTVTDSNGNSYNLVELKESSTVKGLIAGTYMRG